MLEYLRKFKRSNLVGNYSTGALGLLRILSISDNMRPIFAAMWAWLLTAGVLAVIGMHVMYVLVMVGMDSEQIILDK